MMRYIRAYYGVPAKRGGRIQFKCCDICGLRQGTILGSLNQYIRVRMDDSATSILIHPVWNVQYE